MEFFDKLSKKASETYKVTKEKTNKISGELKLKGKISENKEKIEKCYAKLGKMVYQNRTNESITSEEELQNVCNDITTLIKEIENAESDILKLKNIKICEKCSAEIEVTSTFCPKCGAEQKKEIEINVEVKEKEPEDAKEVEIIEVDEKEENTENNIVE